MFIRIRDSHSRSLIKAVSWRALGSLDTFLITFLITGNLKSAGSVASLETLSKIGLYYLHERAWAKVPVGRALVKPKVDAPRIVETPLDLPPEAAVSRADLMTCLSPAAAAEPLPVRVQDNRVFQGSVS
jgi:uncharacterized membrane protein